MPRTDAIYVPKSGVPRSLIDKLGVDPGDIVCVVNVDDAAFRRELEARVAAPPRRRAVAGAAIVFFGADAPRALERLSRIRDLLDADGAIWVVSRKGEAATLKDTDVILAAKSAGLVDVKVVSFSPTHTALKLVIPRAARAARREARRDAASNIERDGALPQRTGGGNPARLHPRR